MGIASEIRMNDAAVSKSELIARARAGDREALGDLLEGYRGYLKVLTARQIDRRLVLGSVTFGVGWGLAGYCPGPAVVAFGAGLDKAVVFVIAMVAGMALYESADRVFHARRRRRVPREFSDVAGDA